MKMKSRKYIRSYSVQRTRHVLLNFAKNRYENTSNIEQIRFHEFTVKKNALS